MGNSAAAYQQYSQIQGLEKHVQVVWADEVSEHTNGNVLIFAPLCVAIQTKEYKDPLNIDINYCRSQDKVLPGVHITKCKTILMSNKFVGIDSDEASQSSHMMAKQQKKF